MTFMCMHRLTVIVVKCECGAAIKKYWCVKKALE